jgi:hypothetical protein
MKMMKPKLVGGLLTCAACCLLAPMAHAHLTYGGRDFGTFSGQTNASTSITNQTVTGNYGWADAADGILGDSHRGRAFRFRLNSTALVGVAVSAYPTTNLLVLTPAFSIYSGLGAVAPFPPSQTTNAAAADHDGSAAALAWRTWWVQQNVNPSATDEVPTDGCWNALGDWKIGGDGDLPGDFSSLSSLIYKGSAASTVGATNISGSFLLPAGDYTLFIGGNDLANKTEGTALTARGLAATLTVTPTPGLSIALKVFVAWPAGTATNWFLQSSSTVNGPTWNAVTNPPVTVDGVPGVVLPVSESQKFFRFNYVP